MTSEDALSPLDAAFLHIESERTPMHMVSIGIVEGPPLLDAEGEFRIGAARRLIASRLELVPKLRKVAYAGLLGEAPPVWIDEPTFDISNHVRSCHLAPPGSDVQLRAFCAELLSTRLDRTRPMWDLTFVQGLEDGNVAVIERLHHAMADGLAATELATVLLDASPEPAQPNDEVPWIPPTPLPVWRSSVDDLLRLGELWARVATWGVRSVTHPIHRLRDIARLAQAFGTLATPRLVAPKSSLNIPITSARSVDFVRVPLAEIHDVARASHATINDVLLTIVTGGLHRLLESRGELADDSELQALVPVGLEKAGGGLANSVSALFVRLPIAASDPHEILATVSAEMTADKRHHQSMAASSLLHLLEPLPQSVLASLTGIVQHQPFFNVVVTNVPGPPVPLYVMGARLIEAFPMVPLAGNQTISVAALSYEGQLGLGVLTDPATCPDVGLFCAGVLSTFQALVDRSRDTGPA